MGRGGVRIDPNIDLSAVFRDAEQLPPELTAAALFGRSAPLELEVGSGKGLFLAAAATAQPGRCFLGIEIAGKFARFAAQRLAKRGVDNAMVAQGDALKTLRERTPDGSLAAIHVYFPDPWWKARHRKRRVVCEPFLEDVVRTLQSGGALHFWTDVEEYFETGCDLIRAATPLVGPFPVDEQPAAHDLDYRTHFERRMRTHGHPVFRSLWRKASEG